jgi:hypothetical protein
VVSFHKLFSLRDCDWAQLRNHGSRSLRLVGGRYRADPASVGRRTERAFVVAGDSSGLCKVK